MKMKDVCRICARELCGNQRRWIFHPASKLNLQVLLSHAVGRELLRDGRGEFACSKCAFMLDRMYRFDTVIARVEAMSLERLHKLLLEKDRLRQCIGALYWKNNTEDGNVPLSGSSMGAGTDSGTEDSPVVDLSAFQDIRYSDMIQDDLVFSEYESWAEKEDPALNQHHHTRLCPGSDSLSGQKPRRCRGCAALRVTDSDYEAVCKVPRRVSRRSTSCGPSTCYSTSDPAKPSRESEATPVQPPSAHSESDRATCDRTSPSPASSIESLDTAVDQSSPAVNHSEREEPEHAAEEKDPDEAPGRRDPQCGRPSGESSVSGLELLLSLLRSCEYRPVRRLRGSKIPRLLRDKQEQSLSLIPPSPPGMLDCDLDLAHLVPELVTPSSPQELLAELEEQEELWVDDYVECGAFRVQQRLTGEQRGHYESTVGGGVDEVEQVHSLQTRMRESEARNQRLQQRLGEMELELQSAQEEAQRQKRNVQNLNDTVNAKETEVVELLGLLEDQNQQLCSLSELLNRKRLQVFHSQDRGTGRVEGQAEVLGLQVALFKAQLELQGGQRAQRKAARTQEDQSRALRHLEEELQGALQHRRETERHNQELQLALEESRCAVQEREDMLREEQRQRQREDGDTQKTIRELKTSQQIKEQLLEDYSELLEQQHRPHETRTSLIHQLQQRIKDRDRALEQAVDEKFRCVEEKEAESRQLRLLLKERERDVERQTSVLANNEETINSLEVLLRARSVALDQVCVWWRNVQQQQQKNLQKQNRMVSERDAIIAQLQAALHARTQEAQDLRVSLLAQVQTGPCDVLEELKVRLHIKEQLFQEVLADRTRQAQEHQDQVQDLFSTIRSRDQHIQDSARWLGEVMTEQTARIQELRRQLSSGSEVRSRLVCELEEERSRSQAAMQESLSRTLCAKDQITRDLQKQLVDSSDVPLAERLTQEVQDLRESRVQVWGGAQPAACGDLSSQDDEDDDDEDQLIEGDESKMAARSPAKMKSSEGEGAGGGEGGGGGEQAPPGLGLLSEGEMEEEEAGFSSLSHVRKVLFSLHAENEDLKHQLSRSTKSDDVKLREEEEEEEKEEGCEQWEAWDGESENCLITSHTRNDEGATHHSQKESVQQQSRPRVSEVKGQAQDEQLKDCRDTLTDTSAQPDNKQIQVDLQDLGYETCGRSENEAEREDTSSPEFDDLEMCTSLDCGALWWRDSSSAREDEVSSLQRLVEDLRSQLSRSQGVIHGLQSRLRTLYTSSDYGASTPPRRVNWSFQAPPSQSGTEDDEGWLSSEGPPHHPFPDKDLRDLAFRVDALEDQLRKDGKKSVSEDSKTASCPGKFDTLIQAQARELSHLRQRLREGRGVCHILTQHLRETTKAFEELLRANDIDYYMGQSFRDQLAQSCSLAQRVNTKISTSDHPEDPEETSEWRLSKELQQKDKLIESLRAKLTHHHHHHHHPHPHHLQRSDTPCSSRAPSETTDQSDCISFMSDEQGSVKEDADGTDCHSYSSILSHPPSISSSHTTASRPSMQRSSSPRRAADSQSAPASVFTFEPCHPHSSICQRAPLPFDPAALRPRYHGNGGAGFSLADVHQELHMLQRQLGNSFSTSQSRRVPSVPVLSQQSSSFPSLSGSGYQQSPLGGTLGSGSAVRAGVGLLDSSALWDTTYRNPPMRGGAEASAGSSRYQSGSELMKEHLEEIRILRHRVEDSILTNERLRQQLELTHTNISKGTPTNIYIQGVDSAGQIRLLKEENVRLQNRLKQASTDGCKEAEHLREAVLLERARLKEAELEMDRWEEQSRKLQTEAQAQRDEITHLREERQRNREAINRLQHELSVLQQQVCESRRQVGALQSELQTFHRNTHSASSPHGSFSSSRHRGRHAVGHIHDFQAVQQQMVEGSVLLHTMETAARRLTVPVKHQVDSVRKLLADSETLNQILEEAQALLRKFWTTDVPNEPETRAMQVRTKEDSLQHELASLRLQLAEKDGAVRDATESLKISNLSRAKMEDVIVSQLLRTRDVLKKAKVNLQVKGQRSLVNSPSVLVGTS